MLTYILSSIICDTYMSVFGKFAKDAMLLRFSLSATKEEEFPHVELLIWGEMNYVGVWIRVVGGGKTEVDGGPDWYPISYHDSCWKYDGVERFIQLASDKLNTIFSLGSSDWYYTITITDSLREKLNKTRKARYNDRDLGVPENLKEWGFVH